MFCPREDVGRFGLVSFAYSTRPRRDDLGRVSPPVEADGGLMVGVLAWAINRKSRRRTGHRRARVCGGGGGKAIGSSGAQSSSRDSLKHPCVFPVANSRHRFPIKMRPEVTGRRRGVLAWSSRRSSQDTRGKAVLSVKGSWKETTMAGKGNSAVT